MLVRRVSVRDFVFLLSALYKNGCKISYVSSNIESLVELLATKVSVNVISDNTTDFNYTDSNPL